MSLMRKNPAADFMRVGIQMHQVQKWVEERMGSVRVSTGGENIVICNATRVPYSYDEVRAEAYQPARESDYILHNGQGQFLVLTKAQFNYWYEES